MSATATATDYPTALEALADLVIAVGVVANRAIRVEDAATLKDAANHVARFPQYRAAPGHVVDLVSALITFTPAAWIDRWGTTRANALIVKNEIARARNHEAATIRHAARLAREAPARRIAESAAATAAAALVSLIVTIKHESAGTDFVQDETHALALAVARAIGHDTMIAALAGTDADPIVALKRAIQML